MTGLDQLAQAAGRCNRNGRLDKGRFVVFRPEGARAWGHVAQAIEAAEATLRRHCDRPFDPAAFAAFFDELYWAKGKEALDQYRIARLLGLDTEPRREGDPLAFQYRTAAERFRMIEDDQETLVVPYDRSARAAIAALQRDGAGRHLLRRLQPFTVPRSTDPGEQIACPGIAESGGVPERGQPPGRHHAAGSGVVEIEHLSQRLPQQGQVDGGDAPLLRRLRRQCR
jgi:CRISPR-associated endonuclease/helicase Cas3